MSKISALSISTEKGPGKMNSDRKRTNSDRKRRKKIAVDPPPVDRFLALKEELLPGLPNDVTVNFITTRIANPLKTFPLLSSVSPTWRQAMQHDLVNGARVRLQSTETFIVLKQFDYEAQSEAIDLLSMQTRNWRRLPSIPFPQVEKGLPSDSQCIALAGRIYVLGGSPRCVRPPSPEVYMWDLVGQGPWKQCAQMREGREKFGCGVLNGKIYVFGGSVPYKKIVRGSEVYDPNQDAWSPIRPIGVINQFSHNVTTVGEELYVYGGKVYDRYHCSIKDAHGLKAYDPIQNKWTILLSNNLRREYKVAAGFFVAQGKILSMSLPLSRISVYDRASKTWTPLHSFSLADIERRHSMATGREYRIEKIETVLLVDNELLALVEGSVFKHDLLLYSRGFNSGQREISWEVISPPVSGSCKERVMCSLQL